MHVYINGIEHEAEYETTGPYHHFRSIEHRVHVSGLKRDKAYAKFIQDLAKAITNPKG